MTKVFKSNESNFPANQAELDRRLTEIEELINNDKSVPYVNIKFCEAAFQLMADCDLITEENIELLCSPVACENFKSRLFFIRNRKGGALRRVDDDNDVYSDGYPRFYPGSDRRVELDGQHYLISNDWYKEGSVCPNKRAFYDWLSEKAQTACEKYWASFGNFGFASKAFIVADTDKQNRPVDEEDLNRRIEEIKALIPQPLEKTVGNNMRFVEKAFTLFKDCGFIGKENLEVLGDGDWCQKNFGMKMNPLGGVLRRDGLTMWDKTNLRYYCPRYELKVDSDRLTAVEKQWNGASKMAVVCEGVTYYISNDWFSEDKPRPTKSVFAENLFRWAKKACEKSWTPPPESEPPEPEPEPDLKTVLKSLEELHKKIDDLSKQIETLRELWK